MPSCINLINVFFRYHNYGNKNFPEQVTNFQFVSGPPFENLMTMRFKHELVQVHSVKYFTDCISVFVYFLNRNISRALNMADGNYKLLVMKAIARC